MLAYNNFQGTINRRRFQTDLSGVPQTSPSTIFECYWKQPSLCQFSLPRRSQSSRNLWRFLFCRNGQPVLLDAYTWSTILGNLNRIKSTKVDDQVNFFDIDASSKDISGNHYSGFLLPKQIIELDSFGLRQFGVNADGLKKLHTK